VAVAVQAKHSASWSRRRIVIAVTVATESGWIIGALLSTWVVAAMTTLLSRAQATAQRVSWYDHTYRVARVEVSRYRLVNKSYEIVLKPADVIIDGYFFRFNRRSSILSSVNYKYYMCNLICNASYCAWATSIWVIFSTEIIFLHLVCRYRSYKCRNVDSAHKLNIELQHSSASVSFDAKYNNYNWQISVGSVEYLVVAYVWAILYGLLSDGVLALGTIRGINIYLFK